MEHRGVKFILSDDFLKRYKRKQVQWGPLGYFTYKRTYARPLSNGKTEEWWQTVQRVVEGCFLVQKIHCSDWKLPWRERQAQRSAKEMYRTIWEMKFLPSGRGLWSMGTKFMFERGGTCLHSCGFVSTERIDQEFSSPFTWLMTMSLHGVGVGFDTLGANLDVGLKEPRRNKEIHIIEDSREGWVEALERILDAYSGKNTLPENFNYDLIRPAGNPIKGFGGFAPGSEPLKKLIDRVTSLCQTYVDLELCVDVKFIVDLMNFIGESVVAGGMRRSSEIALGNPNDEEFLDLKNQENIDNSSLSRWVSNNSIVGKIGMSYGEIVQRAIKNGEPGIFWLENAQAYGRVSDGKTYSDRLVKGTNPCGEQSLEDKELCTLVETFPSRHENYNEYAQTLKYAYLYGKTATLIPTHDPRTNAVMFRNRRIGLSKSGVIEQINKVGFYEHMNWCNDGYKVIKNWDIVYSDWLCIPLSKKVTTVKPSGTVSLLPGVTPGMHFPHSEYYIRRVRVSKNSELVKIMKEAGYNVNPDFYEKDHTMVIEFPVHEAQFKRGKDEVSMWEQFELAAAMQSKWSDNQVSMTITIRPEDEKDLATALSLYETRLKSISFLPLRGDKIYKQAPYESISEEIYEKMVARIKKIRYDIVDDRIIDQGCDGGTCGL